MQAGLFQEAAAPPDPSHLQRLAFVHPRAVRGEGLVEPGGHVAQHLVAARGARGHRRARAGALERVGHAARPGPGRVSRQPLVLGHQRVRHAVRAELDRGLAPALAHQQRRERLTVRELARQRQGLQRQLVDLAALVLHERQNAHHATPRSRITPTTAGAASGPSPRISACLPGPPGTTSRSFSRRGCGRSGELLSTGFWRARSLAGTDG